jgi:PKD repeat protein
MSVTYTVSTAKELADALAKCRGGETVELAAGVNFGALKMGPWEPLKGHFASTVTIRSADPENPATFGYMNLRDARNIAIEDVTFDYTFRPEHVIQQRPFELHTVQNVTIRNSTFDGDVASGKTAVDNGYGWGQGLSVRGSTGVVIEGNEFFDWHRGAVFGDNKNLTVRDNELHSMRSDGMNFVNIQGAVIENNHLHDFRASVNSGDHRDMIQFWTTGTRTPSTDIVIRGNTLDIGNGNFTQSIFMRNEMVDTGQAGREMFYRNITIEDNVIYNAHLHGITVGETDGLTIRGNSVIAVPSAIPGETNGSGLWIPVINLKGASANVAIHDNAVGRINGTADRADWSLSDNVLIQNSDPTAANHYKTLFIDSSMTRGPDGHGFVVQPGSVLERLGAGADRLQFPDAPDGVQAFFDTRGHRSDAAAVVFDATTTVGRDGTAVQEGAHFLWDFGDGTTATGLVVSHSYKDAGRYNATLTVTAPDGSKSVATQPIAIAGSDMISFDGDAGRFVWHHCGNNGTLAGLGAAGTTLKDGSMALDLGGAGTKFSTGGVSRLFGQDSFEMTMRLKADAGANSWGEVVRVHTTLLGHVNSNGSFSFTLTTADKKTHTITTSGANLIDGKAHDIRVSFDGTAGKLQIHVDGTLAGSRAVSGEVGPQGSWGLTFGNAWGKKNFEGQLSDFGMKVNAEDFTGAPARSSVLLDNGVTEPPVADRLEAVGPPVPVIEVGLVEAVAEEGVADEAPAVPPEPEPQPAPAPAPAPVQGEPRDGHVMDLSMLAAKTWNRLFDNAHVATTGDGPVLRLDGWKDYANLGRLTEFEKSDRIAFAVDFRRDEADGSTDRLVWNHMKVGLTLTGDGLQVQVATTDQGFKTYGAGKLGLNDTDWHRAVVMVDQATDRLQVIVDDRVVLDRCDADFHFTGAGGREAGWMLGTPWDRFFDGDIAAFQVSDQFDFLDAAMVPQNPGLVA